MTHPLRLLKDISHFMQKCYNRADVCARVDKKRERESALEWSGVPVCLSDNLRCGITGNH